MQDKTNPGNVHFIHEYCSLDIMLSTFYRTNGRMSIELLREDGDHLVMCFLLL